MLNDLQKCIGELLDYSAFELQLHKNNNGLTDCYIPYMMNDALECYFVLKDCQMTGEYVAGAIVNAELIENDDSPALVLRQKDNSVATVWFRDVSKALHCYRYHEIGHFWVKGQEQWRQLVYIIGTIYDKFSYMSESLCNEKELELLPLMEFAPFRYWSPIHESLDDCYPDTMNGFTCFKKLCIEAGDEHLLYLTERYEKIACSSLRITDIYKKYALPRIMKKIAFELARTGHEPLYELIYQKVCEASSKYPCRDYGETMNRKIAVSRQEITAALTAREFTGKYPRFVKSGTDLTISILVTEEHPFTLSALEYENYEFRIQMMVSELTGKSCYLNQGFFEEPAFAKSLNRGWIAKSTDEL